LPNVKSAKKRMKTNELRRLRNRAYRSMLKTSMKKVFESSDPEEASRYLREAVSILDRGCGKGVIHRNSAARHKSRMTIHVNRLGNS